MDNVHNLEIETILTIAIVFGFVVIVVWGWFIYKQLKKEERDRKEEVDEE